MRETLIIFITTDAKLSYVVLDVDLQIIHCESLSQPEDLAIFAVDREVIVVVPGESVLLTKTRLPKMSRARMLQAIPNALEEQLIDDIEALHFAILETNPQGEVSVAVLAKTLFESWLALLKACNIQPDKVIPFTLALSWLEKTWTIVIADIAIVQTNKSAGLCCDVANLPTIVHSFLDPANKSQDDGIEVNSDEGSILPQSIHITNFTQNPIKSQLTLPVEISEKFLPAESFLPALAKTVVGTTVNLLQGPYAPKKSKFLKTTKLWKVGVSFAVFWLLLLLIYPLGSYLILNQKATELDHQIATIYKRQFPQSNTMVAPKLRLQEKLQKLSTSAGDNRLLQLLANVAKSFRETSNIKIKRIDYQNSQLTMEMTAASSEDFSNFTTSLTEQGLAVKQQNANLAGMRVNATLIIE